MERSEEVRVKMQTRLSSTFAVLAILVAGIVTLVWYNAARNQLRQNMSERLRDMVAIAALQIDPSVHASLNDLEDEDSNAYRQIQYQLQNIRDAGTDIRFVYTLREGPVGSPVFVVDAETDPRLVSHLGDIYESPGEILQSNLGSMNSPMAEVEFYTDDWGTWLSGYAPFYGLDGRREGILAMDISANMVLRREQYLIVIAVLILGAAIPVVAAIGWILGRRIASPIVALTESAKRIASGDLNYQIKVNTGDEIETLAESLNTMTSRLNTTLSEMEQRVADRTHQLALRSEYMEAAAAVAQAASSVLDAEHLIRQVVDLIRERFDLYYVGLFLVDESGEWAVLRSGTGLAGQMMLGRNHRIRVGEGMIGWSIANGLPRVALEAGEDAVRLSTSELPDTRSEAAIPLRSRSNVIGALSVQSSLVGAFDEMFIVVLQTMADQVGVAIDNARLYVQSQEALSQMSRAYGEVSRKAWGEIIRTRAGTGYRVDNEGLISLEGRHSTAIEDDVLPTVSIPIKVRGQLLGHLEAHKPAEATWTEQEVSLIESLVEQMNVALESARLYEDTQRQAESERLISEITGRMRETLEIETVLQTAAREMRNVLNLAEVEIRMGNTPSSTDHQARNTEKG